jgi:thiamine biosynthesis lipoprotein ApbE
MLESASDSSSHSPPHAPRFELALRAAGRVGIRFAALVDAETAGLLAHAAYWHELSGGRFDITTGVLRRCWKFDGSDRLPDPAAVATISDTRNFLVRGGVRYSDRACRTGACDRDAYG